jgi:uncharacterized protein (DUF1800 family)
MRVRTAALAVLAGAMLIGAGPVSSSAPAALTRADFRWLSRVTFGVDATAAARFQQLGRARFLDEQLAAPRADPPALAAAIAALPGLQETAAERVRTARAERQQVNRIEDADRKQQARRELNRDTAQVVLDTSTRHLLRAIASPAQLREQMTWFWMNHFSVFARKANVGLMLAEYETALRERAFGSFRDLVMATVTAPAMLVYLDNAQSRAGQINENYARELMELHTLGVSGGPSGSRYTQQDVQELARVLTGVGLAGPGGARRATGGRQRIAAAPTVDGLFAFDPRRHDGGRKTVLGRTIHGDGFAEVEDAVDWLCRQPATARFVSTKLATYFVADAPPAAAVDAMAEAFARTGGSIAAVLRQMFLHPSVLARLAADDGGKFKDPTQFVVSSLRLGYDGRVLADARPVVRWLQVLGQPLYGRVTPDGYPLTESAWTSSGQLVQRFEIARAIGSGSADLLSDAEAGPRRRGAVPTLRSPFFTAQLEPLLSPATRHALAAVASSPPEWNALLLSSPDWMLR